MQPVGDAKPIRVDVRVISTTHEPLANFVARGEFRSDLYARLAGVTVRIPALKERREDVCALFRHFLKAAMPGQSPLVSSRGMERLLMHDYPMNVRELRLIAMRVAALGPSGARIGRSDIDGAVGSSSSAAAAPPSMTESARPPENRRARKERELSELRRALVSCSGNLRTAARLTGISRQRAYRLLGPEYMGEIALLRTERLCTNLNAEEDA